MRRRRTHDDAPDPARPSETDGGIELSDARAGLLAALGRRVETRGAEARARFAALLAELKTIEERRDRDGKQLDSDWSAALIAEATPAKGKAPKDADAAWKRIPEARREAMKAEWGARASAIWDAFEARKKAIKDELRALADEALVLPGDQRGVVSSCSVAAYASAGSGDHYARVSVEIDAIAARASGVEVEVAPFRYGDDGARQRSPDGYEAIARVADATLDAEILKRRNGMTMREWVRLCWAKGANPRVYQPFLPHGFEERHGLDFFGNDLRARAAASSGHAMQTSRA